VFEVKALPEHLPVLSIAGHVLGQYQLTFLLETLLSSGCGCLLWLEFCEGVTGRVWNECLVVG